MNPKTLVFLLILTIVSKLLSQEIAVPNISSAYLPQSYPLLNPSSIIEDTETANILLSRKQGIGAFSAFNQNYLNANIRFGNDSIKQNAIGIRVLNDQAGKYIGISRLSLMYAYTIQISLKTNLSIGAAPTIINYRKNAQSFGGSDQSGNLDLGIWFNTKKIALGFSINQIFKNKLTVLNETNTLRTQYIINTKYTHRLSPTVNIDYHIIYQINQGVRDKQIIGATINFYKNFRSSFNYELPGTFYLTTGLRDLFLPKSKDHINIDLIYGLSATRDGYKSRNVIEIMLNYEF